ncbi:uncharacterized protein LOC133301986 [Gastrolobium bilobum]|uniref:uncharacterized protein LOC133301986 n=1 Tax=Gastrolobium bilobum TaxID=150636 RepID=UPI002AB2C12B|nr:uncharacterized protein LOC133301986 [Gastrolobium bilobum]
MEENIATEGQTSKEEEDLLRRSNKRNKDGDRVFTESQSRVPRHESWMVDDGNKKMTWREMLMQHNGETDDWEGMDWSLEENVDQSAPAEEEDVNYGGIKMWTEEDGRTHFGCTRKARTRMLKVWEKALIVKLLGRNTGVAFMKKKIEILWARAGKINVTDVGNGFYVVQFSNKDDLLFALNGGPWIIFGHYLSLRRWEPAFRPNAASVMKIAAWVRLPGIPLEYYDEAFFRRIGNWLGKMLKIDKTTNEHVRGQFARICVQLDLAQPLKG